jgi:hypothetical protein
MTTVAFLYPARPHERNRPPTQHNEKEMITMTTATTENKTKNLTKAQARKITDSIKANLDSFPKLIHEALTGRAYLALGYISVKEWAHTEFGLSRSRIYQMSAWQAVEQKLRSQFELEDEWTIAEEKVRNMGASRWADITASIEDALNADDAPTDAVNRGHLVRDCISRNFGELLKEKNAAKVSAAEVSTPSVPAIVLTTGDEKTPEAPAVKVEVRITAVPQDYKVLLRKAVDTGSMLTSITEDDDEELTLAKLTDARKVLDDLIAYYNEGSPETLAA